MHTLVRQRVTDALPEPAIAARNQCNRTSELHHDSPVNGISASTCGAAAESPETAGMDQFAWRLVADDVFGHSADLDQHVKVDAVSMPISSQRSPISPVQILPAALGCPALIFAATVWVSAAGETGASAYPLAGLDIADKWCAECHTIRTGKLPPNAAALTFAQLAEPRLLNISFARYHDRPTKRCRRSLWLPTR